jgi:uncharacterized protein (TIGR02284 family)
MDSQHVVKALGYLYRITEAGERGYAVAATNVSNRALKILFRSYAQQRAKFKDEIFAEIQRLGGQAWLRSSFLGLLGMIHRGRIDIFAALTIGAENVEKVVLKEVMIGERVAIRAYKKTLMVDLPPETREIVARQYEEVRQVVEQVRLMRGRDGKRLVVHLYDSKADAAKAYQSLKKAGVSEKAIEMEELNHINKIELYVGRGTTILETILSGAVGGAIWGTLAGGLAAIGILQIAAIAWETVAQMPAQLIAALSVLGLIAGGAFIGSMIGLFIGWGIASEDRYLYDDSVKHGQVLVRATVDKPRASRAWQIMNQVEIQARTRTPSEAPA